MASGPELLFSTPKDTVHFVKIQSLEEIEGGAKI
jgi:hypothetical protein